jgi:hypothetical protein
VACGHLSYRAFAACHLRHRLLYFAGGLTQPRLARSLYARTGNHRIGPTNPDVRSDAARRPRRDDGHLLGRSPLAAADTSTDKTAMIASGNEPPQWRSWLLIAESLSALNWSDLDANSCGQPKILLVPSSGTGGTPIILWTPTPSAKRRSRMHPGITGMKAKRVAKRVNFVSPNERRNPPLWLSSCASRARLGWGTTISLYLATSPQEVGPAPGAQRAPATSAACRCRSETLLPRHPGLR